MNKILAIAVVAIVVAGAGAVVVFGNPAEKATYYEFEDTKGMTHNVEIPLKNVTIIYKQIPDFMKILGVEDEVVAMCSDSYNEHKDWFLNAIDVGKYGTPDPDLILKQKSSVVITPVGMGVSNADALKGAGIEVIYLDLSDPLVLGPNFEILANLMGAQTNPAIKANYDRYMEIYTGCFDKINAFDFTSHKDDMFGVMITTAKVFQTHEGAAAMVIEKIAGKCYSHYQPPIPTSIIRGQDKGDLVTFDNDAEHGPLKYMFVYGAPTATANFNNFFTYGGDVDYHDLTCTKEGNLISMNPDIVNGAPSPIFALLIAGVFGADIGDYASEAIQTLNTEFGLGYPTTGLLEKYVPAE